MDAISYTHKILSIIENFNPHRLGIYFSLFLHLFILLFAIGLPDLFKPRPIVLPNIIPIEIINISETTSITEKVVKDNNQPVEKKIIKQKKFNASENAELKKIDIQEKLEIPKKEKPNVVSKKEIIIKEKAITKNMQEEKILPKENIINEKAIIKNMQEEKILPKENIINEKAIIKNMQEEKILPIENIESLNIGKIKPKLKPKPKKISLNNKNTDVQVRTKLKPKLNNTNKDVEASPIPQPKPEPDMSLASIYKDLRNEQSNNVIDKNVKEINDEKKKTNITNEKQIESNNSELSISELDLVLQQLRGCFNPQAGTIIKKDEMVVITAQIDRNARVKTNTIQIFDTNINKSNPYYKSITESAMRTLYNPACSILKLPKDKFDKWKNLTIKFDYSWITK